MRIWSSIVVGALCLVPGVASGAAFQTGEISAQANWVVHVDCETFRTTSLGRMIRSELAAQGIEDKMKDFATVFGFNPQNDLRDITLYGQGSDHEKAVALIDGQFDEETLLALVRMNPKHEAIPHGSQTLHRWQRPENRGTRFLRRWRERVGRPHVSRMVYGTLYQNHLIAASAGLPAAKQALDVLQGSVASASADQLDLTSPVPPGTFFCVNALDVAETVGPQAKSPVLRQTEALKLMLGETDGKVFIDLAVTGKSPQAAEAILKIWEGIGALAKLADQERPLLAALGEGLQLSRSDKTTHIRAEAPAELVFTLLKQRWAAKRLQQDGM